MARRAGYQSIDFDAVRCVDLGHAWVETYFGRADQGVLRGIPVRVAACATCGSRKLEHISWDGKVVSRRYAPDDAYIENARALSDTFYERRSKLREAKGKRLKAEGDLGVNDFNGFTEAKR